MIAPARTAALQALRAIREGRLDLPSALANSRSHLSDERDRSLAAEIVTGTVRWQRTLDYLIEHFARRPLRRLDADIVLILELSLHQILHLDRVPAAAVVDDAVNLARAAKKPSATGFVNAVLRSVLRQQHRLPLPTRPENGLDLDAAASYLGITHSHPDWLVRRWIERAGFENAERWVQFNNTAAPLALRANRLRTAREALRASLLSDEIETTNTTYAPDGLLVTSGNPLRGVLDGTFVVQDEASQLVTLAVGTRPSERILDVCASPGGKTTALAADMEDVGLLVASDVRPRRISLLRQTVELSGARCVRIVRVDRQGHLPFGPLFDAVLVDAPCSGLGTVRRDPDIKWRRSEAELTTLAEDQLMLLARAAGVVKRGGRLVYATCSSEPEENEQVVDRFLRSHPEFGVIDLRLEHNRMLPPLLDDRGMFRTLPYLHGLEAFFACAMTKLKP